MRVAAWEVDRGGPEGDLGARLRRAVRGFYERHGRRLPAALAVARVEVEGARAAARGLDLGMPVVVNGGCLVPEVWLGVPEG